MTRSSSGVLINISMNRYYNVLRNTGHMYDSRTNFKAAIFVVVGVVEGPQSSLQGAHDVANGLDLLLVSRLE